MDGTRAFEARSSEDGRNGQPSIGRSHATEREPGAARCAEAKGVPLMRTFGIAFIGLSVLASVAVAGDRGGKTTGQPVPAGTGNVLERRDVPAAELDTKNESWPLPGVVYGPILPGGGRRARLRSQMVGSRVRVEGMAAGEPPLQPAHMTSQRVAYEGGIIFVKGVDFARRDVGGKTVRVVGTLRLEGESVMEFGGREPIKVQKYYYLDAESLTVIHRVRDPVLMAPSLK